MSMSESEAMQAVEQTFLGTDEMDYSNAPEELRGMLEQIDKDISAWIPEPGDQVFGVVADISESAEGDFGAYPIILVKTPSGNFVHVHCFHTVLRREIDRRVAKGQLAIGDLIAIKYVGEGEATKGKQAARMYRVAVRKPKN